MTKITHTLLTTALLWLLGLSFSYAQNVIIPDANFKAKLVNHSTTIDTNGDGEIQITEAEAFTGAIIANSFNIDDVTGLEAFINVTKINFDANNLTSIDVSSNTLLEEIFIRNNSITALDITDNTALVVLYANNNSLTSIDLSQNSDLNVFWCGYNNFSSIDLSVNNGLEYLWVSQTGLTSIDISNNLGLISLILDNNALTSLDISNHTSLTRLEVNDNSLTSFDLSNHADLQYIRVHNNSLTSLDVRNGNNENISTSNFNATGNAGLSCISVSDLNYANSNWTNIDATEFKIGCDPDEIINIPDANFKAELVANGSIDTTDDDEITVGEAEAFTGTISVSAKSISDLTGIEYFTNITILYCAGNSLTELNLQNNTALTTVVASSNQLSSIDVSNNTAMEVLYVANNSNISSIDISNLTNLTHFQGNSTKINTLDVSNNTALINLEMINTFLTEIDLSSNIVLEVLNIKNNLLTKIDLSNNTLLVQLWLPDNILTHLDISDHTSINSLDLDDNELEFLNVKNTNNTNFLKFEITGNSNLTCVTVDDETYSTSNWTNKDAQTGYSEDCIINIPDANFKAALVANGAIDTTDDDQITVSEAAAFTGTINVNDLSINDLSGIEHFTNVTKLYFNGNSLTSLDISNNKELVTVQGYNNQITSVDLTSCSKITNLNLTNSNLSTIDLSDLTALKDLYLVGNDLLTIDISNNTLLVTIGLQSNGFTELDLSTNTALVAVFLQDNNISTIDVSNNTSLTTLFMGSNGISAIDLSTNTQLDYLNLESNNLSSIDLTNNTLLEILELAGNSFSSIDLSLNTALTSIGFNSNNLTSLNVSTLTNLEKVTACCQNLGSIDISNNLALTEIWVQNNSITDIDLNNNPDLVKVVLYNNQLTSVDLRNGNNGIITYFTAINNANLTCIDVDNPTYSAAHSGWNEDVTSEYKVACDPNDIVNIPDANFKTALLADTNINTADDGEITYGEAENFVGAMDVSALSISEYTGLEAFINLTEFDGTANTGVTSFDFSNNIELTRLDVYNNPLTALDVSNNTKLTYLEFGGNTTLTSIDLTNNTSLTYLNAPSNASLSSIDISNLENLHIIYLQNGALTSLDLRSNTGISQLRVQNNNLGSLDLRHGNPEQMNVFDTKNNASITCISVDDPAYFRTTWSTAVDDTNFYALSCDPNEIVYIPDANFKAFLVADGNVDTTDDDEITYGEAEAYDLTIDVNNQSISDLTGIEAFTNLTVLLANSNSLTGVDVRYNVALTKLNLTGNDIGTIDLTYNTQLLELYLLSTNLTELDLSNNTSIYKLYVTGNPNLTSIDLSPLANLQILRATGTGLTSIDFTNNPLLNNIEVKVNDISSFDFSQNPNLAIVNISNNQLTSLDLSNNPDVTLLWADGNQFTDLDISANTLINNLDLDNNNLSSLNVANGNNTNFAKFEVTGNSNLSCITVDDVAYSQANWSNIDAEANFSTNCSNVETDITAFSFAEQSSTATIDAGAHTINVEVVVATDLSGLTPTFTISSGATVDNASGAAQDFSSSFVYTVTAENPTATQGWSITVQEENVAPTDIALDNASIYEVNKVNDVIGVLSSSDVNVNASHSYTLVAGTGDTDNASFGISGNNLIASEVFDYESKSSYLVRLQTNDGRGGTFEEAFTITVNDVSDLPNAIIFEPLADVSIGTTDFELIATATSGETVTFSVPDNDIISITGNMVTINGVGTTTITAHDPGGNDHTAAFEVSQTITVNKLDQDITFAAIAVKLTTGAAFNLTATTDASGLDVAYTSSDVTVATIEGSTVTIVGAGSTTITASQGGNATYNSATDVLQTLTVNKVDQTISFNTLADVTFDDVDFDLAATTSSTLGISYASSDEAVATISGSTVTIISAGATTITASQTGNATYNSATDVLQTLTVNKADQTIIFDALADVTFDDADFDLAATASSTLGVSYASSNETVAIVEGSTVTILGAGTTTITASQMGDDDFSAATDVMQLLTINKVDQTITLDAIADKMIDDTDFEVASSASSSLEVSLTITGPATLSGTTITLDGSEGTVTLTASQGGDNNYNAATDASVSFDVTAPTQLTQTISFAAIDTQLIEDGSLTLTATSSSGLDVSYEVVSGAATVSGSLISFTGLGLITVKATQTGNDSFLAAEPVEQSFEVVSVTSVEVDAKTSIYFYPNPATNYFFINSNELIKQVQLIDVNGKQLLIENNHFNQIDISDLRAGNYLVKIITADRVMVKQLIKKPNY